MSKSQPSEAVEPVSAIRKRIAKYMAQALGGTPRVDRYYDPGEKNSVDILRCKERPSIGVNAYGTIGLSDSPLMFRGEEYPSRIELVGACASGFEAFANVLATAAFHVAKDGFFCAPGVVFPDVFAEYHPSGAMKHLYFMPPFLWEGLKTLEIDGRTVAWLMAIPISHAESSIAVEEGPVELERRFERAQIDFFDPDRPSIV